MTHTTPSKEELRKLCEFIRNDPSDYIQSGLTKHLARVLTERLDHDDIIAEIEARNKVGEGINLWSIENRAITQNLTKQRFRCHSPKRQAGYTRWGVFALCGLITLVTGSAYRILGTDSFAPYIAINSFLPPAKNIGISYLSKNHNYFGTRPQLSLLSMSNFRLQRIYIGVRLSGPQRTLTRRRLGVNVSIGRVGSGQRIIHDRDSNITNNLMSWGMAKVFYANSRQRSASMCPINSYNVGSDISAQLSFGGSLCVFSNLGCRCPQGQSEDSQQNGKGGKNFFMGVMNKISSADQTRPTKYVSNNREEQGRTTILLVLAGICAIAGAFLKRR